MTSDRKAKASAARDGLDGGDVRPGLGQESAFADTCRSLVIGGDREPLVASELGQQVAEIENPYTDVASDQCGRQSV